MEMIPCNRRERDWIYKILPGATGRFQLLGKEFLRHEKQYIIRLPKNVNRNQLEFGFICPKTYFIV